MTEMINHWRWKISLVIHFHSRGLQPRRALVFKKRTFFTMPRVWGFKDVRVRIVHAKNNSSNNNNNNLAQGHNTLTVAGRATTKRIQ